MVKINNLDNNIFDLNESVIKGTSPQDDFIRVNPEETLWETTVDLGGSFQFQASITRKGKWFLLDSGEADEEENIIDLPISDSEKPLDTRMNYFFQGAFVKEFWGVVKSNSIFKVIASLGCTLFAPVSNGLKYYFLVMGLCVLLGVIRDTAKKEITLKRANKLIMQQVYMLVGLAILTMALKFLITEGVAGPKALNLKEFLIYWFFWQNIVCVYKYLCDLGVPFPNSWRQKTKAISDILD